MRSGRGHRTYTRALALLAVFSVLSSLLLGGHRYFYCALMSEVSLDACCEPPAGAARDEGPGIERNGCCTSEHFAPAAPGFHAQQEVALRAPLLATVKFETFRGASYVPAARARVREARAGPGAPDAREHLLRLMSFLT